MVLRQQAGSYKGSAVLVGAGLLAVASVQTPPNSRCKRHHALVMGLFIGITNDPERFLTHGLAVQERVDFGIGHAVGRFVRFAGRQVFEVGGGDFFHQRFRRAEAAGNIPNLIFHQAAQRGQVASPVTELGKEAQNFPPPEKVPKQL